MEEGRRAPSAVIDWMEGRNEIHIEGEGTDLYLEVGGRIWLPADGGENFPDGEIFTGPIETATRGHITYSFPAIYGGVRSRASGSSSMTARSSTRPPARTRTSSSRRSTPTRGPGSSARSASARTTGSKSSPARCSSTRRSAARSTWRPAPRTRSPAASTSPPSTGTWSCDLRKGGRVTVDGDPLMEDGKLLV